MKRNYIHYADFKESKKFKSLSRDLQDGFEIAARLFPFQTNRYIIDSLVNWRELINDPIFKINFPHRQMIPDNEYQYLHRLYNSNPGGKEYLSAIESVRSKLLPKEIFSPSKYVPKVDGQLINGLLHSVKNTVIVMARPAKQCFAHCSYCLVWPIHIVHGYKYGYSNPHTLVNYLEQHKEVTNVIFSGGDMLNMPTTVVEKYISPILSVKTLQTIRIATRALSWWPYRFTKDADSDNLLRFFNKIVSHKKRLILLSHICHPNELDTHEVEHAVKKIHSTGTMIYSQSPLIKTINDSIEIWIKLLERKIALGLIPYYAFLDAGNDTFTCFKLPFAAAYKILNEAVKNISGLVKTMCGPVIDHKFLKIEISGVVKINEEKKFVLKCLQSPDPEQKGKITMIPYDNEIKDLKGLEINFR